MKTLSVLLALALVGTIAADALARGGRGGYGRGYGGFGGFGSGGYGGTNYGFGYAYGNYGLQSMAAGIGNGIGMGISSIMSGQAANNYQAAYHQSLQNQLLREQTYFDMKRMNASFRAEQAMLHPAATPEEVREFNQARAPAPLSANDFDPGKGVIQWPGVLNREEFKDSRGRLEGLFAEAAADPHGSGLGTQNFRDIQNAIDEMDTKLHSEIAQFKPDEYIPASKFLKSLAYQARTPGADPLATQ